VWDAKLAAGERVELDFAEGHTTLFAVPKGKVAINGVENAGPAELVVFERAGTCVVVEATEDATVLVLSGEPIAEPVCGSGPFVMNSDEEIQQAFRDFNQGRLGRPQQEKERA